ncbi:MAG: class I SAM-dependent DNA methyltransferase, partial [Raoultibacter sp.]
ARECYPESTLADMYDPDNDFLFPKLTAAHKALDAVVEQAYGVSFNGDEEKIVAHLFKLYAKLAGE